MPDFADEINSLITGIFRSVMKFEEKSLKLAGNMNLSISEMHLLETIGKDKKEGRTISELAQELQITLSSVTIAVNKLAKKGCAEKVKIGADGRLVHVRLTKKGGKFVSGHKYFHRQMVKSLGEGFTDEEKSVLLKGFRKVEGFFEKKLAELMGKQLSGK